MGDEQVVPSLGSCVK